MNKSFWNLYKGSDKGKRDIELFNPENKDVVDWLSGMYRISAKYEGDLNIDLQVALTMLLANNCALDNLIKDTGDVQVEELLDKFQIYDLITDDKGEYILFDDGMPRRDEKNCYLSQTDYREKAAIIHIISSFLYSYFPFCIPVLYKSRFDLFRSNCEILGIELPDIPRTKDYAEYLLYYLDICDAVEKFRQQNDLTSDEVCACIYFYAEMEKGLIDGLSWSCNEKTCRGDIVVVYAVSPHSCIHSIWRADSGGRFNPFDNYHCRTTVRDGVLVPKISLKELKEDSVFGSLPMMSNNLHGINGRELPPKAYSSLLKMLEKKGADMSKIPVLFENSEWNPGEIKNERDVEEKILIPFLKKISYTEEDWSRQLELKAGRKEKAIPDFVFFPTGEKHAETAPLLIEAKKGSLLSSDSERTKAYKQARSYAKMLEASIFAICDAERIIVYQKNKDNKFNYANEAFESHWSVIYGDEEAFSQINKLIGKNTIKR